MTPRLIVGIDPGLHGGLALLHYEARLLETTPMPIESEHSHTVVDLARVVWLLQQWRPEQAVVEVAHPSPQQGATSAFTTGRGYGSILGVLAGLEIPTDTVRAVDWQRNSFVVEKIPGEPKASRRERLKSASTLVASRRWPHHDWRATPRCTTPHDGMSDAALIALWWLTRRAAQEGHEAA